MESKKPLKKEKDKKISENIINTILNSDVATFLIIFGLFGGIIFLLVKFNPGNLIINFPRVSFWVFFILILFASTIFYFVSAYKTNKGKLLVRSNSNLTINVKEDYVEWCHDPEKNRCKDGRCKDPNDNDLGPCNIFVNFLTPHTRQIFEKFIEYPLKILLNTIFLFGTVILGIYLINKFNITIKLLEIIIMTIIIIISLGIIYLLLFAEPDKLKPKHDFGNFMREFIFFIPCLLIEFIKYLKNQFKITTKITWILLFLEVILILFYFIIPNLLKQLSTKGGTTLLKGPIYTNNLTDLGSIDKKNLNYSIALQLWINPQPENTSSSYSTWTSLFNYGNRPNILYNGKKKLIKIVSMNGKNDLVSIYQSKDFPYQSWMKILIIYRGSIIDVFLNDKLVGTLSNVKPYITSNKITSGVKDGINGGIKDIIYFNRPLDKNEIIWVE